MAVSVLRLEPALAAPQDNHLEHHPAVLLTQPVLLPTSMRAIQTLGQPRTFQTLRSLGPPWLLGALCSARLGSGVGGVHR
jgi:hypothetical protein